MAIKKVTTGSGITQRKHTVHSGADMEPAIRRHANSWNRKRQPDGGDYGAAADDMVRICNGVLARGGPQGPDTPKDFARRILDHHEIAIAEMKRGNTGSAMRFAFEAGQLWATALYKWGWEEYALRGKTFAESKRGRSDLYKLIDELLGSSDTNPILLEKLRQLATQGNSIIQEIDDDDGIIYWRNRNGVEKATTVKSVLNVVAKMRRERMKLDPGNR